MSTPVIPTIIRGPAIVYFNSYAFYVNGDIKVSRQRSTFDVESDMFGKIDVRHVSMKTDITFTPAGEIESIAKYWPYGPSSIEAVTIAHKYGGSILNGAVVIKTKAGRTSSYNKAAITKPPTLILSPKKTAWGPMTITAIGDITTTPTNAAFIKTEGAAAFSDTSFTDTKLYTDLYEIALGARSSPYDSIGARDGIEIEPQLEIDEVSDENVGVCDLRLTSISYRCRFAPNNLTEAEVDALVNDQASDAILPGQSVARGPASSAEDLVITGDHLVTTLHNVGIVSAEHAYGAKVDNNGNIEFAQKMAFTTGAPTPLVTVTIPT